MNRSLTVFLPAGDPDDLRQTIKELGATGMDLRIIILARMNEPVADYPGTEIIQVNSISSSETIKKIALHTKAEYTALYTRQTPLRPGAFAFQRMIQIAENTSSGMIYSDYLTEREGKIVPNPVIEYQEGSLRDDFNFGSLLLFQTTAFIESAARMKESYDFAGLYDLRLKLSQKYGIFHIAEFLYTETESDLRKSGEKQFDYVDPRNRKVQIEMELACTAHLRDIGAFLQPTFRPIHFDETRFPNEASVIIPVRNREKTIADAIESVLKQKTDFNFNLIIVDNHSTDKTTEIIRSFARNNPQIVHVIPDRTDLGIGGCWNEAVFHQLCGKFAIQLDSDDLYIDDGVITRIVNAFYSQNCAMVVGSYRMVNFSLQEIPPGIIDHKEWTPDNGRNNALRINGLGAPRAFYTPVIRSIRVPNVSYGEDYALGLNICRYYQIGRIYEPLYLCRRWEENSDASLDVTRLNAFNFYKDKIRTIELLARRQYVQEGQD